MPASLECHGDIEVVCDTSDLEPNLVAQLVFRPTGDASPPFQVRIRSPRGGIILERVLRDLPTVHPQSAPPVSFTVGVGKYEITITQLKGSLKGEATLNVTSLEGS